MQNFVFPGKVVWDRKSKGQKAKTGNDTKIQRKELKSGGICQFISLAFVTDTNLFLAFIRHSPLDKR